MKGRTLLTILLLSAILGALVYVPIEIFRYQDKKILKAVHTESLDEEGFQILNTDVLEKLSFIASMRLAEAEGKVSVATSNVTIEDDEMKVILLNAAEELQQLGLISGTEFVGENMFIEEAWWVVYMNTDVKKSMSCYIITAHSEQFSLWMQTDRSTGKIYEVTLTSSEKEVFSLSGGIADRWAEYLGISLERVTETYTDEEVYRIENSNIYYRFFQSADEVSIQILDAASLNSSASVSAETF